MSRKKTKYIQAGVEQGMVYIQGEMVKKVDHFEYLGVVVSTDGSCEKEVRRRVQAGWQNWRRVSGVLCDRKLSARLKGKIYKCAMRLAVLNGMETVVVTERMMKKMEATELKIVRWALGVTLKDRVRNNYIWGTVKIRRIGEKLRGERLRWFGHVKRREESYIGRRMMKIEIPGKRTKGRLRRRWNDNIKEDMKNGCLGRGGGEPDEVENGDALLRPLGGKAKKKKKKKKKTQVPCNAHERCLTKCFNISFKYYPVYFVGYTYK